MLEPSESDSRLVPEANGMMSAVTVYADDALSKERRRHEMEGSECDDGSQDSQRDSGTNQKKRHIVYPKSSTKPAPKPSNY